jgi:hypothetical protein
MPRKSIKKMMKELMAKKKLTAKEKKFLMKMQKGGVWWNPLTWGSTPAGPVDEATLAKQYEDLKGQICKVCKAAFGEDGCKCGNTAPPSEEPSTNPNVPVTPINDGQISNGEGDIKSQDLSNSNPSAEPTDESQGQGQPKKNTGMVGGKRKSNKNKNKNKRSKRASKKMNW